MVDPVAALPFPQPQPLSRSPQLRELQRSGAIHRIRTAVGDEGWLVTGYQEVWGLLDDDRLGRAHSEPDQAARTGESALFGGPLGDFATEQADHARMRGLLQPHFSPRRIRELRPRVEALTNELFEQMIAAGPPADLVDAVALPLPIAVICELLGVPYADREQFHEWTQAAGDVRDRSRSEQGLAELFGYGMRQVERKRREPGDDVISRLCATDGVSDAEAAAMGMFLLFAGHETTVVAIGTGAARLLSQPGQLQSLAEAPNGVGPVVEEMLRTNGSGGGGIPRYARTDLTVGGVQIRAGELVLLDTGAANHDDAVFAHADRFDPERSSAAHLTFGRGARYCIGAPLARVELHAVFSQLISRLPQLRLAVTVDDLAVNTAALTGGLLALPVTW